MYYRLGASGSGDFKNYLLHQFTQTILSIPLFLYAGLVIYELAFSISLFFFKKIPILHFK